MSTGHNPQGTVEGHGYLPVLVSKQQRPAARLVEPSRVRARTCHRCTVENGELGLRETATRQGSRSGRSNNGAAGKLAAHFAGGTTPDTQVPILGHDPQKPAAFQGQVRPRRAAVGGLLQLEQQSLGLAGPRPVKSK
jgi:hypothetical protein